MSRNHGKNPKLELKLKLSGKQRARGGPSTTRTRMVVDEEEEESSPSVSPPSSCVSSEEGEQKPEATTSSSSSMVLAGCPRCLMYVMLSEKDPKCPKCNSTVLVDFHRGNTSS